MKALHSVLIQLAKLKTTLATMWSDATATDLWVMVWGLPQITGTTRLAKDSGPQCEEVCTVHVTVRLGGLVIERPFGPVAVHIADAKKRLKGWKGNIITKDQHELIFRDDGAYLTIPISDSEYEPWEAPEPKADAPWTADDLHAQLKWVSQAMSSDASRPGLCGVHVKGDQLTATDGHRAHRAWLTPLAIDDQEPFTVPRDVIPTLIGLLVLSKQIRGKDAPVEYRRLMRHQGAEWTGQVEIKTHDWAMVFTCVSDPFPDVSRVLPEPRQDLVVSAKALKGALTVTSVNNEVDLTPGLDWLKVAAPDASARQDVPTFETKGEHTATSRLNTKYLAQLLGTDDVVLTWPENNWQPLRVDSHNRTALVMPHVR